MSILGCWYLTLYLYQQNTAEETKSINPVAACMNNHRNQKVDFSANKLACAKCIGNAMITIERYYHFRATMHHLSDMIAPTTCHGYQDIQPIKEYSKPQYLVIPVAFFVLLLLVLILPNINWQQSIKFKHLRGE